MRIFESKNFRGFLHRTAGAFFLCALLGLLLVIPSVSSDTDAAKPANIPLYSDWRGESLDDSSDLLLEELLADDDGGVALPAEAFNVGSFSLHRPQSELFINGLIGELYGLSAGAALESDDIEHYLQARARARLTGEAVADFKTWLSGRGEGITDRVFLTSADYLTNYLTAAATDGAHGLRFVRTVEWDYQSSLGDRRWQTGLSALGALRESADDAIAWQLRGYAAEDSGAGANAGLIYRRASGAADGALLGVNVFLDYEKHGDYDEDFLRWSLGGEYRNAYLDVYLNRYFPITDGVKQSNGNYVYTQGGQEAYLNVKAPDFGFGRVSGGLTYYLWEGEYGDADDKGFRYHIGFAPQRGNLRLELELDSPDGGSTDWGGRVSYRHTIGAADKGNASASSDAAFDARAHFFDVVRREYAQRIRESGDGAPVVVASLSHTSENDAELAFLDTSVDPAAPTTVTVVTLSVAEVEGRRVGDSHAIDPSRTVSITVEMNSTLVLTASNWLVTVFKESAVRLQESGSELSVSSGTISFQRSGSGLNSFNVAGTRISLLGTQGETGIKEGATYSSFMRLMEGTIALTITTDNQINLDIVELEAVAMVSDARVNADEPVMRMVGCGTPQQRENHRILQDDFAGCADDVRISLVAGQAMTLYTQETILTLTSVVSGVEVRNATGASITLTAVWADGYPFHPHSASLISPDTGDIEILHAVDSEEDSDKSTLQVAPATTLAFSYVDEAVAATTTAAVDIYVAVIGDGTDSGMVSQIGTATETVVDCDANARSTPTIEGLANVIAICGDVAFVDVDDDGNEIIVQEDDIVARIEGAQNYDVTVSGAGGNYVFAFVDAAGAAVETGSTLSLAAATATIATLHFSPDRRIEGRIYYLRAAPLPAFAAYADAATLTITANAKLEQLEVERAGELVATVVTEVEWNKILYRGFEVNGGSNVTYEYIGGACDRSGCNDLTNHFSISSLNGGELRVITTLVPPTSASAEMPGGIPVSLLARPGETPLLGNLPLEVILTVRAVDTPADTTDDRLKATVTAEFKVVVRNPSGDVTTSLNYPSQMRDPDDTDFAVVGRVGMTNIATFSGTGNIPITTSSGITISVAGLFSGLGTVPPGTYEYELVNNPPHFVIVSVRPGTSAAVQLDEDNLPGIGAHSVTVRVDDNHSLTEPIERVVAVSIVTPLARSAANDLGLEVDIPVVGADQTITLITVTEGLGDYTYTLESVTPATAAGLFSVAAFVQTDGTTVGAVSFKDDGAFRDSKQVVAVVLVQDGTNGMLRYHLTVNVSAPYEVVGNVPNQFIATNINEIEAPGNNFHNFPSSSGDGFIIGGTPPYEYALIPESAEDGDDFAIDVASGGLVLDGAATAGGLATVGITVRDGATPDANVTSYLVTVQAINGNIDFDPVDNTPGHVLTFSIAYNVAENGAIATITAAWEDDTGYGELSHQLVPAPSNPNLLRTVSIDPASGILSLERAVAVATASVFVRVNVAENGYASGDVTIPDEDLLVRLDFHTQVDFVNPQTRIEQQIVSGGGANTALATFAASGGTGDYAFSIEGTPAANVVNIDPDSGALSQTGAVNAALTLSLTLRVTDANEDLGGSRDVEIAIEWTAPPPLPDFEGNAGLGRILIIGGGRSVFNNGQGSLELSDEVWESGDGLAWTLHTTHTGANAATDKRFPARHGHAAVSHRGTVYVSGGGNGNFVSGNPPATFADVWVSGDGSEWALVSDGQIPQIANHNMLARSGDLFIVGGESGGIFSSDVWRSDDGGVTWDILATENNVEDVTGIVTAANAVALFHGGTLIVIDGDTAGGKVAFLDEKATPPEWKELGTGTPAAAMGSIGRRAAFVFNGQMRLSRGEEMLSSADGSTWVAVRNGATYGITSGGQIRGHAAISASYIHTESDGSKVRRSRAIITGGQSSANNASARFRAVWSSTDGGSGWSELKQIAEFDGRSHHAMVLVQREGLRLLGPDSSEDAPIENSFPYAAADLFKLTTGLGLGAGTGAKTFEIESSTPPSLKETYLAVDGSNGMVTQKTALPTGETAILGTVIFKVTDSGSPDAQTDTFKAVVRLRPLAPAPRGTQRVLLIGGQISNEDYRKHPNAKLADGSADPEAGQLISKAATNDIYASEDGEDWVKLKRAPGKSDDIFSERAGHAVVALGGTVYVSGGRTAATRDGVTHSDEVWSSTDGAHWTLRSSGAFPARSNHKMLTRGGTLFIIGGLGGSNNNEILKDIWYSNISDADANTGNLTWTSVQLRRKAGSSVVDANLGHNRKNFLAYFNRDGDLIVAGGRSNWRVGSFDPSITASDVKNWTGNAGNLRNLPAGAEFIEGIQPHGRKVDGTEYDSSVRNDQRLDYVAADGVSFSYDPPGSTTGSTEHLRILARNNVWAFRRDSAAEAEKINTAPAYKCFSDVGTVGHKAARLSSTGSNTLLAIGGLDIDRPAANGIYNDVWSSADDGVTWQLLQKFPPFTPRYDQAVVTYTPPASVPALSRVSSSVPLQLKRVCGGVQAVQNDSLADGDELFRVQAGGGNGNYDYSVVSVTPDNAPIDAGALAVVADSADPSIRIVQLNDTPAPVAERVDNLGVRVQVSDGTDTATVTAVISLLPQSGLKLEGPYVPVTRQSDTNGRINNLPPRFVVRPRELTRTNPNLDDPSTPDDDDDNKDNPPGVLLGTPPGSEGPTEAGVELFRVRTSGGSGEYAKYSYSIIGVEHTPLGGNTILDASYFSVTPTYSIDSPTKGLIKITDPDDRSIVTKTKEIIVRQELVGAFAGVEQARLTDTHATVTLTVEVSDGGNNNEKSILTVEVELFPSPTLELLVYHAPPSSLPLPPHVLSQRPDDCLPPPPASPGGFPPPDGCADNNVDVYQPAIQISDLSCKSCPSRQFYYRYRGGGDITVYTPEVGDELFRVGASGIEKSAGGYDFSVVGVLFEKDEATPHSEIGLVELATVADAEKFIGQDNSKIRIVRLKKELPEELMDENERLIVDVRVSNGDATVNLAMTVHLSSLPRPPAPPAPPPPEVEMAPGILVIGGRQTSNDVNNNAQRINNVLFLNLGQNVGWSELSRAADFSVRSGHAAAVLDGTVYISGGVTGTQLDTEVPLNEVWASSNYGANWIKLDPNTEGERFPARYYHKMIEHDGTLFVIGGIKHSINPADEAILNDVWTSTDGANWTQSGADNVLGHNRNTFLAFVYKGTLMIAGGHSTNRGLRAYNNGAWDDVANIPALPAALYTHDSSLTDRDSSVDAPLAPHDRDPVGAAVAVFNDTIIIYARNHVWSWFDDGDDNTTDVWTRSVTQAPYGYLLGFEDLPRRRTGHLAAVRSNAQGEDIAVLLIGGVEHTSTQSTLDDGAGVWASDSGITRRTDIPVAAPGTGVRQGIIGIDFPAAPSSSAAGSDPIGSSMFGRYGHALVVIKPEVVASP